MATPSGTRGRKYHRSFSNTFDKRQTFGNLPTSPKWFLPDNFNRGGGGGCRLGGRREQQDLTSIDAQRVWLFRRS